MRAIVTGGAGFIGSTMVDFLLQQGCSVKVVDHLGSGKMRFLEQHNGNPRLTHANVDLKDERATLAAVRDADIVFHFAANADVKGNVLDPTKCLWENAVATSNVLEAMRKNGIKQIVFSSTCSVYGEPDVFPTPEDAPFPVQTSMYAASKVYCEGLISAYCLAYGMRSWIYRFVSVLGERYTHGVVFSFSKQLLEQERSHQPLELAFLSDGTPTKSYMYVGDCVSGIWHGVQHAKDQVNIFNLGTDEEISAREIGEIIIDELGMHGKVRMTFGTTQRGWVGDAPHIRPSIARLQSLGWRPQLSIRDAIRRTVRYLKDNPWTLGEQYFRGAAMDERTFRT